MNINDNSFSRYMYEQLSTNNTTFPIMSTCSAHCFFCSNKLNPFQVYSEKPRPVEEIKKAIRLLNSSVSIINLSFATKMQEGEAILHPNIFEILKIIRERFPKLMIEMFSNGISFNKQTVERLAKFNPIRIIFSIHSFDRDLWCRIFGKSKEHYEIAINSLELLIANKILIIPTIVPMPNLVGWEDIHNTIKKLSKYSKVIWSFNPGYTKFSDDMTKYNMTVDLNELSNKFHEFSKTLNVGLTLHGDVNQPMSFRHEQMMNHIDNRRFSNVLWMISEMAYDKMSNIITTMSRRRPSNHSTCLVKNHTYGGNITSAGLLLINDFKIELEKQTKEIPKPDCIILPRTAFDHFGEDLTGINLNDFSKEIGIPILTD